MPKQTEVKPMSFPAIRLATDADCAAINDIYNHYVATSTCTYQTEPESLESRQNWLAGHGPAHPAVVAEVDGNITGWGSLSRFHPRAAYARTVEIAVYIHHSQQSRGIGQAIELDLLARAKMLEHHTVIALISAEQSASLALHAKLGFSRVGLIKEAGFKFNRWLDVVYMQKML
jgi:L-amino acid N-acyltransferase YncA